MQSKDDKARIVTLLLRFVNEISASEAQDFTDINRESQNVLVNVLRLLYNLPDLKNLDIDHPNHAAIDLADETARVAIQVTSTTKAKKIHESLTKFGQHKLEDQYSRLIVFILTERQKKYTANFSTSAPQGFAFEEARDIIDHNSLVRQLNNLSREKTVELLEFLEYEFGESTRERKHWLNTRFAEHSEIFVEPAEFSRAKSLLNETGLVIITGPPHIGKTETAYELLLQAQGKTRTGSIKYIRCGTNWNEAFDAMGSKFLIDDPFGDMGYPTSFNPSWFQDLLVSARNNYIVVTSRDSVALQAIKNSRATESGSIDDYVVSLEPERSYNDSALHRILEKHIDAALARKSVDRSNPIPTWAQWLRSHAIYVVEYLRFPHNIGFLVSQIENMPELPHSPMSSIDEARNIERAVESWYNAQDFPVRMLCSLVCIFPRMTYAEANSAWRQVCEVLNIANVKLELAVELSSGYMQLHVTLDYRHPSYAPAVRNASLDKDDKEFSTFLADRIEHYSYDLFEMLRYRNAWDEYHRGTIGRFRPYMPQTVNSGAFLSEFLDKYIEVLSRNFPTLRLHFDPYSSGQPSVIGFQGNRGLMTYCLIRSHSDHPEVLLLDPTNGSADQSSYDVRIDVMADEVRQPVYLLHYFPSHRVTSPRLESLNYICSQATRHVRSRLGTYLDVGQHLRSVRLISQLRKLDYPIHEINPSSPLTYDKFTEWLSDRTEHTTSCRLVVNEENPELFWNDKSRNPWDEVYLDLIREDILQAEIMGYEVAAFQLVKPGIAHSFDSIISGSFDAIRTLDTEQIKLLLENSLRIYIEGYMQTVEQSFPTLCKHMALYRRLPALVNCVIDLREASHKLSRTLNISMVPTNPPEAEATSIVNVHIVTDDTVGEDLIEVNKLLEGKQWLVSSSFAFIYSETEWVHSLLNRLGRELDDILGHPFHPYRVYDRRSATD